MVSPSPSISAVLFAAMPAFLGCGSRTGVSDDAPAAAPDVATVGDVSEGDSVAVDTTVTPDTEPTVVDTSIPITFVDRCEGWPPAPAATNCKPISVTMDDSTTNFSLDPRDGSCALTKTTTSPPRVSPIVLWIRDRRSCVPRAGGLCYGFDALHLNVHANGESALYGFDSTALGTVAMTPSVGEFDGSAACGDSGCWKNFPVDTDIVLTLRFRASTSMELCRVLRLTIRYTSARELKIISLEDAA